MTADQSGLRTCIERLPCPLDLLQDVGGFGGPDGGLGVIVAESDILSRWRPSTPRHREPRRAGAGSGWDRERIARPCSARRNRWASSASGTASDRADGYAVRSESTPTRMGISLRNLPLSVTVVNRNAIASNEGVSTIYEKFAPSTFALLEETRNALESRFGSALG